jgi:hypothetical protein
MMDMVFPSPDRITWPFLEPADKTAFLLDQTANIYPFRTDLAGLVPDESANEPHFLDSAPRRVFDATN